MTTLLDGRRDTAEAATAGLVHAHREVEPVEEIRRLKRIVQAGVYGAILGTEPMYYFVLHYSAVQIIVGLIIGLIIATSAIEGAFSQIFKLRKRSSYPSIFFTDLGARSTAAEMTQAILVTVRDLFGVSAVFVASMDRDEISVAATDGVTLTTAANYAARAEARESIVQRKALHVKLNEPGRGSLTFVPVVAWQRQLGLLGIIAQKQTTELKDTELMEAIGNAIGLSLENIYQREGLQQSLSLLSATLDSTGDGILVVSNEGSIVNYNERFKEMWRVPDEILVLGRGRDIVEHVATQVEDEEEFQRQISEVIRRQESDGYAIVNFKDGRVFERYHQPHRLNGDVVGRVWSFRDITDRKQSEETIRHLAYHDALTDLPNRALFADRLTIALAQARRTGQGLAVMFLDIDRFKLINDTLGHTAGDELLKSLAVELGVLVRQGDTVARVGGDEFTLLLTGITDRAEVDVIAERVLDTVRQAREVTGKELRVSTSIGIAFFPRDGADAQTLLRNADTAMYRAKQQGRDNYQVYAPAMSAEILDRVSMESELRRATARGEFVIHYQPQIEAATGRITGVEALIRWNHPERGMIYPTEFIGVAEETGLIVPIGEWVLREACEQNKRWQERGLPPVTMTVNLAARQFQQENLVDCVSQILADTGLDPSYLEMEITEGTTIQNPDFAASVLRQLREMGVHVSIDDFGTGYSSLNYLKRFRIDRLKIDRSFVADLITDPNDAAIATAMIVMAHSLGLSVVAEGVETHAQLEFLLKQGCDHFQGYLLGRPMPAREFEGLLEAGARVEIPRRNSVLNIRDISRPA